MGVLIAATIYLVFFDQLSETALVQLTPVWFFPIAFGYYGFVAERLALQLPTTQLETVSELLFTVLKETQGGVGKAVSVLVHAPFVVVRSKNPMLVALGGSLIWAMLLWIFFAFIFPAL